MTSLESGKLELEDEAAARGLEERYRGIFQEH
jgi:hypothetical protein